MKEQSKLESTALAVAPAKITSVIPINSVADLESLGTKYAASGFFGQISAAQGCLVAQSQREEGVSITEWIRRHQVIGTTISTRPNWMLGEFKRRGGKVHIVRCDSECCEIEFTHWDGEKLTGKLTMLDMRKTSVPFGRDGKTLKTNWQNFPDDMLFARVCGKSLRRLCPEVFCGMYTDGEVMDFDRPAKDNGEHFTPHTVVAAVAKVSSSPIAEAPAGDPSVCPCGSVKGKPWTELSSDTLKKILATPADKAKALTDEHRNAIISELGKRQEAAEAENEAVTPEVVEG